MSIKIQCCLCHAFKNPDGTWKKCPLIISNVGSNVSHTYCPKCSIILNSQVDEYIKRRRAKCGNA